MDRRAFLAVLAGTLATSAAAQPGVRVYRIGLLHPGSPPPPSDPVLTTYFWGPLNDLGYVEGRNLGVERRYAEGRFDRLPGMARELVQRKVDVILAVGTLATQSVKRETTTMPIVFLSNSDPVATGLVASLAKPGGNLTGVLIAPEGTLASKKLELLKESVPRATRIAYMNVDEPGASAEGQIKEIQQAASALRVEVFVVLIRDNDYETAFATIAAARPGALFVGAHSFFVRDRKTIIGLATKHRLPAIYEWPLFVRSGGLMSYGASETETYRQMAAHIDTVLKGANPGEVPIWQPRKLYLVINIRAAKEIGVTLPQSMLLRADELVQ